MKTIKMKIECPSCKGTGLYQGMAESDDVAVICYDCKGTGEFNYEYNYNEFTGIKKKEGIKRVYKSNYGYKIGSGKISFDNNLIDMDKEGVSYQEFLDGKLPEHIRNLVCPLLADQSTCHSMSNFIRYCNKLNGGYFSQITSCKNYPNKSECWDRFYKKIRSGVCYMDNYQN